MILEKAGGYNIISILLSNIFEILRNGERKMFEMKFEELANVTGVRIVKGALGLIVCCC